MRLALPSDAPLLATLNRQLILDEQHRNSMNVQELTERMTQWLQGEYQAALFEEASAPIGYALFRREPEHVYLRQFFVSPQWRRQGIGRAALSWLWANAWVGAQRVRLDVLVNNTVGLAFWRSVGFEDYCVTLEAERGA